MKKLVLVILVALLVTFPAFGQKKTELLMGTASMGGAFYPVGQGIANLVTKYSKSYSMVPVVTGGAVERVDDFIRVLAAERHDIGGRVLQVGADFDGGDGDEARL